MFGNLKTGKLYPAILCNMAFQPDECFQNAVTKK
jgi:hypothetical protein